jgi:hypothetical protein
MVPNITPKKRLQCQDLPSNPETVGMTWSLSDSECVTIQLERDLYGITSKEQKLFKKEFFTCWVLFEAWWETIGIQMLCKNIE